MNKLEVNDEQLQLIQNALDFYARVGIGQFNVIKEHPTFEKILEDHCRPKKKIEVGDKTPQGEILEIKDGKALINGSVKDGKWNEEPEWKDVKDVVLSTDYALYHTIQDNVDDMLLFPRNGLLCDNILTKHASLGIHNKKVDKTCRMAFDIVQVIRHEYWKKNPKRSNMTVDSHIHFTHREDNTSKLVKCYLE